MHRQGYLLLALMMVTVVYHPRGCEGRPLSDASDTAETAATALNAVTWRAGVTATAFCTKPDFLELQCGFASSDELKETAKGMLPSACTHCNHAGQDLVATAEVTYAAIPQQPILWPEAANKASPANPQTLTQVISLACKGQVMVRTVFKHTIGSGPTHNVVTESYRLPQQYTDCSPVQLTTNGLKQQSAVVRCELQLPQGPGSEAERAVKAKEGQCYICTSCEAGGGCPAKPGAWYSDTVLTTETGCGFDPNTGYKLQTVSLTVSAPGQIQLAKYQACSSPGCFNQAYEAAKQKAAKACKNGKCA
eukprot:GHUV01000088.1.p1 GENE.GHUV01000088.1~~GHUV01000088.1.p1  ORF type:complete len:306 (+),score=51.82 GHUV01000088.1:143-1060(+)